MEHLAKPLPKNVSAPVLDSPRRPEHKSFGPRRPEHISFHNPTAGQLAAVPTAKQLAAAPMAGQLAYDWNAIKAEIAEDNALTAGGSRRNKTNRRRRKITHRRNKRHRKSTRRRRSKY